MVKPWDTATIGDFLDFKNGLNKGKEFFGYGTPIVNYTDVYRKRGLTKSDVRGEVNLTRDEIHRFDARKNDVFFTRTSETPEEVGMSSVLLDDIDDCVFSGFVLRGRPKNDMFVPEYCKYCFTTEAIRSAIIMGCTYTTRALTNGTQLSAIEIVVPPKPEQEAIAKSLTEIDDLISSLEKLMTKKKAIKQGAMQELLTGKRRLPGFFGEWEKTVLGTVSSFYTGGTPSKKREDWWNGDIPWISSSDLTEDAITSVNINRYISKDAVEHSTTRICPKDAVLVVSRVGVGKVAVAPCELCTSQDFTTIVPHRHTPHFLAYMLIPVMKKLAMQAQGTSIKGVTVEDIQKIIMPTPTIDEQNQIVDILANMDSEIEALEQKLEKYRQVKQGMMQQLLTGKIRLV